MKTIRGPVVRYWVSKFIEECGEIALRPWRARALNRHRDYHLADRRPTACPDVPARAVEVPDQVELLSHLCERADVPMARVPIVVVAFRSATGDVSAGASTTCLPTQRCVFGSHTDCAAIR